MPKEHPLREELTKLHQLLADVQELDNSTRNELQQVSTDIDRVLGPAAVENDHTESLQRRIGDLVLSLETEHPRITGVLSQITDMLSGMGI